jgi:hypothetical protein
MTSATSRDYEEPKSGRVLVRMPLSLHEALFRSAQGEGVSMNQFICGVLAVAVGWRGEFKEHKPVQQIRNDLDWEMWRDRMRSGPRG